MRRHWEHFIARNLAESAPLIGLLLVMDARHPLTDLDHQMLGWFLPTGKPIHVLLTKCDKLSKSSRLQILREVRLELGKMPGIHSVQLFSSLTREGLDEAITIIWGLITRTVSDTNIAN
jgi:GTP-binding protein